MILYQVTGNSVHTIIVITLYRIGRYWVRSSSPDRYESNFRFSTVLINYERVLFLSIISPYHLKGGGMIADSVGVILKLLHVIKPPPGNT